MKKAFLLPVIITCLLSCQKQTDVLQPSLTSDAKREFIVTEVTEPYTGRIWNTCLLEYVSITGTATYYTKTAAEGAYYLDYQIDLDKAIGTGEVSGIVFKGGGRYEGKVQMSEDGLDVKGKVFYNIKYHAPHGNKMGYKEHATFIQKDGVIKVQFDHQDATCE